MSNIQQNPTNGHDEPKITLRDRLIQLAILTGTIGIAIASVATGMSAPLGLVTTAIEMSRIAPQFEEFNKTRPGRALKFAADIIFTKPVVRAFKLLVPILGLAGLGVATGGIAPVAALCITGATMVYKIGREIHELRKTRNLEQQLTSINAINTAKEIAEHGPLQELQNLGIKIPNPTIQHASTTTPDVTPDSKFKTFVKSAGFSLLESTGMLAKAFIGGNSLEEAASSLLSVGGIGKETELTISADADRNTMKKTIIAAGGKIPYDQDKLKAEEKAHKKYTESLIQLTHTAKNLNLSKEEVQQRFNVINDKLQTELQAPPIKDNIFKRAAHQILQVFKDIVEVHKPNISDPRAIFAEDPNDPRYNTEHNSPIDRVAKAQQEQEQYYKRFEQIVSSQSPKTTTPNVKTNLHQQSEQPKQIEIATQPETKITNSDITKEVQTLERELLHHNTSPAQPVEHKTQALQKFETQSIQHKPKDISSTLSSATPAPAHPVTQNEMKQEVQILERELINNKKRTYPTDDTLTIHPAKKHKISSDREL